MTNSIDIQGITFNKLDEENEKIIRNFKQKKLRDAFMGRLIFSVFAILFIAVFQCIAQIIAEKGITATIVVCLIIFAVFNFISFTVYLTKAKMVEISDDVSYLDITVTKLLDAKQVSVQDNAEYLERMKIWREKHEEEIADYKYRLRLWKIHYKKWSRQNAAIEKNPDYLKMKGEEEIPYMPRPVPDYSRQPKKDNRHGFNDSSRIPNYLFFTCVQGDCNSAIDVTNDYVFKSLKVNDKVKLIKTKSLNATTYDIIPM